MDNNHHQIGVTPKLCFMFILLSTFVNTTTSRELRPSEHGLPFQNLPPKSPDMDSFFGEGLSPPENPPDAGIPMTSSDDSWWRETPVRKVDNVRKALLVATVVCGGTGVILLLAAAVLFADQVVDS